MKFDYLIAGAGYAGSVIAERIAEKLDKKVLIIDRRGHIAGNAYDYYDDNGVLVHKYGPHIFHTSSKKVWNYLSRFTGWKPYYHKPLAFIDGKKVPIPFNFNTMYELFPQNQAERLEKLLIEKYGFGKKIPILKLIETKDADLKFLADFIYQKVFYGYTLKQWGMKPEELDFSVTSRVPVYLSRDNNYFQDQYQAIPASGYTAMLKNIISHKNIHVMLQTDFKDIKDTVKFDKLLYTGPIDTFFDYLHGRLPYRSLRFDLHSFKKESFQEASVINYPNNHDYTRITEYKKFIGQEIPHTTIAYEYPEQYKEGKNEPYYPIPKKENHEIYEKYRAEAEKLKNVVFAGRLAEYKYYDMDEITGVALMIFKNQIAGK